MQVITPSLGLVNVAWYPANRALAADDIHLLGRQTFDRDLDAAHPRAPGICSKSVRNIRLPSDELLGSRSRARRLHRGGGVDPAESVVVAAARPEQRKREDEHQKVPRVASP